MVLLCWNLSYPLTCRSAASACPYIMCEYSWVLISSVKSKRERGDSIRLAWWHTSVIQTGLKHPLHWKRKASIQHKYTNANSRSQVFVSLAQLCVYMSALDSHTDKHTAAVTAMTHHKVLRVYVSTQWKAGMTNFMQMYFTERWLGIFGLVHSAAKSGCQVTF